MHGMQRWVAAALASRRLWRAVGALGCVAAVLLAHGVLWLAASPSAGPTGPRTAVVQVRQLTVPAPVPAPEPAPSPVPVPVPPEAQPAQAVSLAGAARAIPPAPRPRAARSREQPGVGAKAAEPAETASAAAPDGTVGTGDTGGTDAPAQNTAAAGAAPVATYPTRIPSSTQLNFVLQRGAAAGEATLHWQVDAGRYVLQLQATLPQGRAVEQRSQGGFDEAGLAPLRLADRRRGRDVRAANFQREQRKISFSGPRSEWPLQAGAQDRLSWLVQLVAIAAAAPDAMHEGAQLSMWVVGTRGAFSVWRFEVRGRRPLAAPSGDASAWWLVREPEHPYDLRVEVWLDPARGHWPLRLRQTQVPGGEPLEWTLRDDPQPAIGS